MPAVAAGGLDNAFIFVRGLVEHPESQEGQPVSEELLIIASPSVKSVNGAVPPD